jgi:hypothetical protein
MPDDDATFPDSARRESSLANPTRGVLRMRSIRLIRNKAQLSGTCYFELLPGRYQGKCWNDGAVFLTQEAFGLIDLIIMRHEPKFDHFSFVAIQRSAWERIIPEIELMATDSLSIEHAELARELSAWLREQISKHKCISILGL